MKDTSPSAWSKESEIVYRIRMKPHRPSKIIQMPCPRICDLRRKNTFWHEWNLEVGDLLVLWFVFHKKTAGFSWNIREFIKGPRTGISPNNNIGMFQNWVSKKHGTISFIPIRYDHQKSGKHHFFNGQLMALSENSWVIKVPFNLYQLYMDHWISCIYEIQWSVIKVPFNSQPRIGSGRLCDGLNPGDANEQGS